MQLDWVVRGNHAPFFVARDKGYFAEQGIDAGTIRKGTGSTDALRLVANGNADFGFGPAHADGGQVAGHRQHGAGGGQPEDAAGHHLGEEELRPQVRAAAQGRQYRRASGRVHLHLPEGGAGQNGISLNDIKQSTVSPPYENFLLLNRVNAVPGYIDAEVPELEHKAGGPGSLSVLHGEDLGIQSYGSGMFTADKTIAERPDLVRRFVAAYMKGYADVIQDPARRPTR